MDAKTVHALIDQKKGVGLNAALSMNIVHKLDAKTVHALIDQKGGLNAALSMNIVHKLDAKNSPIAQHVVCSKKKMMSRASKKEKGHRKKINRNDYLSINVVKKWTQRQSMWKHVAHLAQHVVCSKKKR
jgi:dihydroxyacetone kinase-like predicted kinase